MESFWRPGLDRSPGDSTLLLICAGAILNASKLWRVKSRMTVSSPSAFERVVFQGRVTAGPVKGATVTAYTLTDDGTRGAALGSATTDGEGRYTLPVVYEGPLEVVSTGGFYMEEASGNTVILSANQEPRSLVTDPKLQTTVSITPLTDIAASRAKALIQGGRAAKNAIETAADEIEATTGLTDIYSIPANPESASGDATPDAKQYAVFLAGISQLGKDRALTSLELMQAFREDFQRDGMFDGLNNGTPVSIDGVNLRHDDWTNNLEQAQIEFVQSPSNKSGFEIIHVRVPIDAPPPPGASPTPSPTPPPTPVPSSTPVPAPTPAPVYPAGATRVIISGPNKLALGQCVPYTFKTVGPDGLIATVAQSTPVELNGAGLFYANVGCTVGIQYITFNPNTVEHTVYYKTRHLPWGSIQTFTQLLKSAFLQARYSGLLLYQCQGLRRHHPPLWALHVD